MVQGMAASTVGIDSPQGKCICLCHSAAVPHRPFVTVPLWNKRRCGKILNVYDDSGHLVLHSTTLPPAFQCLQLYVKCHIQRSEEREWFEVTDLEVFESSEQFSDVTCRFAVGVDTAFRIELAFVFRGAQALVSWSSNVSSTIIAVFFHVHTLICVISHAPSTKRQITLRFTRYCRTVGHR